MSLARLFPAWASLAVLPLVGCSLFSDESPTTLSPVTVTEFATPSPTATITAPTAPTTASPSAEPEPTPPAPAEVSANLSVATVNADGSVTLTGFVVGVAEDGGTCTFQLTSPSARTLSSRSEGLQNMGTTACGTVDFSAGDVSRGTWTATLIYSSATSHAETSREVRVP